MGHDIEESLWLGRRGLAGIAAGALWTFWSGRIEEGGSESASVKEHEAAAQPALQAPSAGMTQGQVHSLAEKVQQLEQQMRATKPSVVTPPSEQTPLPTPRLSPEELEQRFAERTELLESTLAQGARNDWAVRTEEELSTRAWKLLGEHPEFGASLDELDCAGTLCRIRLSARNAAEPMDALRRVAEGLSWSGERFFKLSTKPAPEMVLYASKEETPLPDTDISP